MLNMQKNNVFVLGLSAVFCILAVAPSASGQVDVEWIRIKIEKNHTAGTPWAEPFDRGGMVFGTNLNSVQVTSPTDITEVLEQGGSGFWYWDREEKYTTLDDLYDDFPPGDYLFVFNKDEASEDSVTVSTDPEQPTGLGNITYPTDGATDVPLNPTFVWDSCSGYGDTLFVNVSYIDGDDDLYMNNLDIEEISWAPGPLVPGHLCSFEVSVETIGWLPGTTENGDAFDFSDTFQWTNYITFTTEQDINIVADTITPKTKWITCHIRPPDGYDVTQIDPDSIRLNDDIQPVRIQIRKKQQMLVVKFSTSELSLIPDTVLELTVTGEMNDETTFEGTDSIEVVQKGGKPN